jgi:hypothetical protein
MGLGLLAGLGKALMTGGKLTGLGSIVGQGAFGLGSDMLSNKGALKRQQLADQQNMKFWHMQNEYNTPANQMKRLQDAGLNPNLIYGSGSANTGVAGSISPSKPAPYNIKNPVPLQAMMMTAQINNLNSVTKKNDAETARTLGLTPFQVNRSMSQANQAKQQAIAEKIKTSVLSLTQQDQVNKIVEEALLTKAKKTEAEAKAAFTKKMLDININPNSGIGSQINQFIFGTSKDAYEYFRSGAWKDSPILK